uniref:Glycosyltransferase 2-like domain-containing protein n=1 Tax=Rhodosorus marinus TaxID=101924 RepID=A0A7S2ZL97_9RHOD|mmetsp:Transcript_23869/g.93857  ORF Transcript_23869/g.93857 Transcript_23869/m.93857 type:complete len:346 (+) Transcript_23869:349-1386(+)
MQSMEVTAISSIEHILAWIGLVLVISQIKKVLLRVLSAKDGGTIVGQEFTHPDTSGHPLATSSVFQQPSLEISVVIPVQPGTGKLRLQGLLNEAVDSLKLNVSNQLWEIVLVGPPGEELTVVGKSFLQMLGYEHIRLLILPSHSLDASGFAGILRRGVLVSRGKFILTCDTSGSVRFSDFVELERTRAAFSAERGGLVVGSRWQKNRNWYSGVVSKLVGAPHLPDPTCPYRWFTNEAAALLFSAMESRRSDGTDEILILSRYAEIPVLSCPIRWTPISEAVDLLAAIRCAVGALSTRLLYSSGYYAVSFPTRGGKVGDAFENVERNALYRSNAREIGLHRFHSTS